MKHRTPRRTTSALEHRRHRLGLGLGLGLVLGPTAMLALGAVGPGPGGADLLGAAAAYAAAPVPDCAAETTDTSDPGDTSAVRTNPTAAQLDIADFQSAVLARGASTVGGGVTVMVVDSGVKTPAIASLLGPNSGDRSTISYPQGTTLAGIVAGPEPAGGPVVGIAPGARIVDERVYDAFTADDVADNPRPPVVLSSATVAAGLTRIADKVDVLRAAGVRVVLVGLQVAKTTQMTAAVRTITAHGIIVVAPSGNRTQDDESGGEADASTYPQGFATAKPGEDVADEIYPAGYSLDPRMSGLVVAVGTTTDTVPDPSSASPSASDTATDSSVSPGSVALYNSATDVAAPSLGAVSYRLALPTLCQVTAPSTSIAAAQVAGVLAGLLSERPAMTPSEAVQRLEFTATGPSPATGVVPDKLTGYGVIQPFEAATRVLRFDKSDRVISDTTPQIRVAPATLPQAPPDVLRSTRHHALWWGLGGGAALLIAVMLRPVLARRR